MTGGLPTILYTGGASMNRIFGFATMVFLMSVTASASDVRKFNIEVSAQGIKVENADFNASALRVSFDAEKELLLLEGSAASPVTLTKSPNGNGAILHAQRIKLSLKDFGVRAEGIRQFQSVGPR
jgi:hypothetical protein